MNGEEPGDRRKYERFQAQSGGFAVPRVLARKLWQIIDISRGGLSFRYIPSDENSESPCELDILTRNMRFSLEKIPFKIVSDYKIADELASGNLHVRRRSVRFGTLSHEQASQLEYFIRTNTSPFLPAS